MSLCLLIPTTFLLLTPTLLHADTSATTLLEKAATTTRQLQTLRATVTLSRTIPGKPAQTATGTVLLMHPNLARVELKTNDPAVPTTIASNGKTLFNFSDPATYTRTPIDPQASQLSEHWWSLPARFFFSQKPVVQ